jgi:hypothetical protein
MRSSRTARGPRPDMSSPSSWSPTGDASTPSCAIPTNASPLRWPRRRRPPPNCSGSAPSWPPRHRRQRRRLPLRQPRPLRRRQRHRPIEVSSGPRKIHRPSRPGNRRLNHAIHTVAITQIRFPHSDGRAYDDRKIAEAKTAKEALRALKRRINDALDRQPQLDARRAPAPATADPGGPAENDSEASVTGSHPEHRLLAKPLPNPRSPYDRPRPGTARTPQANRAKRSKQGLDNKEASICGGWRRLRLDPISPSRGRTGGPPGRGRRASWRAPLCPVAPRGGWRRGPGPAARPRRRCRR